MTIRRVPFVEGEYYHIYNRGNNKQQIFFDKSDYERFIKLLYICNSEKKINFRADIIEKKINAFDFERGKQMVSIGAWVLMPNHFHLYILQTPGVCVNTNTRGLGTTLFLARVCNAYSKYINAKYNRTGSLFEGRFKSVHVNNDNQAKYLFSYIHLNPIKLIQVDWKENGINNKNEAINFLNNYKYSSYLDYINFNRIENKILNKEVFPDYFTNTDNFQDEIFEWLSLKDNI